MVVDFAITEWECSRCGARGAKEALCYPVPRKP